MPQTATPTIPTFDPTKFGATLSKGTAGKPKTSTFDPTKFGATPFDPAKLGATPVDAGPDIPPSLLASRQAASKSEFERNLPAFQTPEGASRLTAPLDFAIGLEHTFGLDPMHPISSIPSAAKGMAEGLGNLVGMGGPLGQVQAIKGLVKAPVEAVKKGGAALREGNLPETMQAIGEGYGVTKPLVEGGVQGAKAGYKALAEPAVKPLPGKLPVPQPKPAPGVQHLVDAVDGGKKMFVEDRLRDVVNSAQYDLKRAETEYLGRPVESTRDAAAVAKYAKGEAWKPYQQLLEQTNEPISRDAIVQEAVNNLPSSWDKGSTIYNSAVRKIMNTLQQDQYHVLNLEEKAQALNAELKAYYKQNNLERAASSKIPATASREALYSAYRNLMDKAVEQATGHDPAPLRKRYGNLQAVESALIDQPTDTSSLYDILTKPGHVITPRSTVSRAAEYLLQKTPDKLVAKAFSSFAPNDVPLSGELHPGPIPERPPFSDQIPRHSVTGEILMPPSPISPEIMRASVADKLRAGQSVDFPNAPDTLNRDSITGELLMKPGTEPLLPGTTQRNYGWQPPEPSPDVLPRNAISGELTPQQPSTPYDLYSPLTRLQLQQLQERIGAAESGTGGPKLPSASDLTRQGSMPSENQLAIGKYTVQDLQERLRQIDNYLRSNPKSPQRGEWTRKAVQLRQEIARRQAAQKAGR